MWDGPLYGLVSLVPRRAKHDNEPVLVRVFISFHIFSFFGNLVMLITVLCSRSIRRRSTWFSFVFSWMICTFSYSLLFWAGALAEKKPPYILCLIQSSMIYAAAPLTAGTTLALVTQVWFLVRSVVSSKGSNIPPLLLTALLVVPYLFYVAFLVGTLVLGWGNPYLVRRAGSGMYCSFASRIPGRLSALLVTISVGVSVVLEVLICKALCRQWVILKKQPDAFSLALRVVAFTFICILVVALSILVFVTAHHGGELNIVVSIIPVAAVFIFAIQADLIRVWMFWKGKSKSSPTEKEVELDTASISDKSDKSVVVDIHH